MRLTNRQVDLLEHVDDFTEWIECLGSVTADDVDYLLKLVAALGDTIEEEPSELAEECPWTGGH